MLQTSQPTEQSGVSNLSCDQFNQSFLAEGKIASKVFILPLKTK